MKPPTANCNTFSILSVDGWKVLKLKSKTLIFLQFGHEIFGRCLTKFSGHSPVQVSGRALVDADIKVIVRRVRIETRPVQQSFVTDIVNNVQPGRSLPHLVFNFWLKIDGTVRTFDLKKLKLSGCELQVLGQWTHLNPSKLKFGFDHFILL